MKKFLTVALLLLFALSLSACSSENKEQNAMDMEFETLKLKDGVYFAQDDKVDEGFKESVEITIENGKIAKVVWDGISEKDETLSKKQASISGEYDMKKVGARWDWHEQAETMEAFVVENGGLSKIVLIDDQGHVDAITGVSIKVKIFKELAAKALAQAVEK